MTTTTGQHAVEILERAVAAKWLPTALERVRLWGPVLAEAYDKFVDGDPHAMVHVPSYVGEAGPFDVTALDLLSNFDHWLGRGIVWASLDFVTDWNDE